MPIASDLHDALWTFVVQALPAGPQKALPPRARVPVPGCSEVSQPGLPSCLVGPVVAPQVDELQPATVVGGRIDGRTAVG
ncbi:hypothetical protein BH20ACT23_BH20ACT23_10060 [soil metagenome]